jgi:hypothetical protein
MPPGGVNTPSQANQLIADAGRRRLIANALAARGQGNDTMLAHLGPQEAAALQMAGGAGTMNPATGLPQFDDSDVSRGSSFAGEDPTGAVNPDPTLTSKLTPSWGDKMLDKIKQHPGVLGALIGGLGGAAGGPMAGGLGTLLGLGLGAGGQKLGLWGGDGTSGTPSSYTAGGIPAFSPGSAPGGSSDGFTLAKMGLLGKLGI